MIREITVKSEGLFTLVLLARLPAIMVKKTHVDNCSIVLEEKAGERLMNDSRGGAFYELSERVEKG